MSEEKRTCSFCGKSENDVKNLIEGEHAFICNECVETCGIMLQDNESGEIENELAKAKEGNAEKKLPTPAEIVANLNDHVIGQEHAKSIGSIGLQSLQTPAPPESGGQSGIIQVQHPAYRPYRLR